MSTINETEKLVEEAIEYTSMASPQILSKNWLQKV